LTRTLAAGFGAALVCVQLIATDGAVAYPPITCGRITVGATTYVLRGLVGRVARDARCCVVLR
jgi:hypothetical protein